MGAIIGKGGATINDMSAQCGAQMKVQQLNAPACSMVYLEGMVNDLLDVVDTSL